MAVLITMLGLLIVVFIGYLARRLGVLPESTARALNPLIINITLPALILSSVLRADIEPGLYWLPLSAIALMSFTGILALLVGRTLGLSRPMLGAFILAVAQGNTAYIGYPVVHSALGDAGLLRAIFFDNGVALMILSVGVVVARHFGEAPGAASTSALKEMLRFPPLFALPVGLMLRYLAIPTPIVDLLALVGVITIPLVLISVGVGLRSVGFAGRGRTVASAALLKLVLSPLLVLLALWILALTLHHSLDLGLSGSVAIFQAAMPTGVMTVILSERYGLDTEFLAATVLVTTICAAITLPLLAFVLGGAVG